MTFRLNTLDKLKLPVINPVHLLSNKFPLHFTHFQPISQLNLQFIRKHAKCLISTENRASSFPNSKKIITLHDFFHSLPNYTSFIFHFSHKNPTKSTTYFVFLNQHRFAMYSPIFPGKSNIINYYKGIMTTLYDIDTLCMSCMVFRRKENKNRAFFKMSVCQYLFCTTCCMTKK